MRLRFRHQKFQADAAKAVCDVFAGQPYRTSSCTSDKGSNHEIVPGLDDAAILENIQKVQRENQLPVSPALEGRYNLTVEMETGVGKTYTYIKTMYELNKQYGWKKFIIVVPSIAVREGVYKSFEITQEHFAEEYGKKIRFFIYDSSRLEEIDRFGADSSVHVMIINSQAFNARGKDARKIYMKLDDLCSRRPIDIIAKTNPILIIDEPQSVEGRNTRERLKEFHPLMTLRYSATHRKDRIYNMVYRLDAAEAYNKRLVKKIAVKGISETGSAAAESYVYLESVNLSRSDPTATIQFDKKSGSGIRKVTRTVREGFDLYVSSNGCEEYKNNFVVKSVNGWEGSVEFLNGIKIHAGEMTGRTDRDNLRRIQIRETILSHIERERQLFHRGIKVLSLFFIDEVKNYRKYDDAGLPHNGIFAQMFEEEYMDITARLELGDSERAYEEYLKAIKPYDTHAGYFSVDRKGRMIDSKVSGKQTTTDDAAAYDLIMKDKELLLDRDPERSPVRFIFSHSALREGWDNPNVFQICTLKQSSSEVRKRQEVGRGLRLSVDQNGERMDESVLGKDVQNVNVLTVIASESYDDFARGLQAEMAESSAEMIDSACDPKIMLPENARNNKVELCVDKDKLNSLEFQGLWSAISRKSVYTVDFDTDELVRRAVAVLDSRLRISRICYQVDTGIMEDAASGKGRVPSGSFEKKSSVTYGSSSSGNSRIKYDLIGKLADETGLTRKSVVQILTGIRRDVFEQFKNNPEEFIIKCASLINDEKAEAMVEHITYHAADERCRENIFTDRTVRGRLGVNVMKTEKHLYDYVVCDSAVEREFVRELEADEKVAVYVKLPESFSIATPAGRYTPGWAIALRRETSGCAYFVVGTKEGMRSGLSGAAERARIHCAGAHFRAVGGDNVSYVAVDSFALSFL